VVKAIANGHVILADPGFGNLTMKVSRFQELWKNGIVFIVHPPDERMIGEKKTTLASRMVPDETIISRKIGIGAPSNPLY
jgi:predicted double-glycine peptidase